MKSDSTSKARAVEKWEHVRDRARGLVFFEVGEDMARLLRTANQPAELSNNPGELLAPAAPMAASPAKGSHVCKSCAGTGNIRTGNVSTSAVQQCPACLGTGAKVIGVVNPAPAAGEDEALPTDDEIADKLEDIRRPGAGTWTACAKIMQVIRALRKRANETTDAERREQARLINERDAALARAEAAEGALHFACGFISTTPEWQAKHPEAVVEWIKREAEIDRARAAGGE